MFIRKTFLLLSVVFLFVTSIQAQNKFVRVYYDSLFSYFSQYTPITAITALPSGNLLLNTAGNLAIKTNNLGEVIENKWLKKNGEFISYNMINNLFTHSSSNIYFCGAYNSDTIMAGIADSNLQISWTKGFVTEDFQFMDAHQCNNGDLLLLAYSRINNVNTPFVCIINNNGDILWQKHLYLDGGGQNLIRSVNEDNNGNLYFGGNQVVSNLIKYGYVIKTDAQLNVEFAYKVAGCQDGSAAIPLNNGNIRFFAANLIQGYPLAFADIDNSGNLIQMKGLKSSTYITYPNFNEVLSLSNEKIAVPVLNSNILLLLEQNGDITSLTSYLDSLSNDLFLYPYAGSMFELGNNLFLTGVLLIGVPESFGMLLGIDKNTLATTEGYYLSQPYEDTVVTQANISSATAIVNNVSYGININNLNFENAPTIKDTAFGDVVIVFQRNLDSSKEISLYPNPASHTIYINTADANIFAEIKVYDITGKEIIKVEKHTNIEALPLSNLEKGIYTIVIKQNGKINTTRFVKM